MGELAAEGKAILFCQQLPDRITRRLRSIGVMSGGKLREVRTSKDWTEESIIEHRRREVEPGVMAIL